MRKGQITDFAINDAPQIFLAYEEYRYQNEAETLCKLPYETCSPTT